MYRRLSISFLSCLDRCVPGFLYSVCIDVRMDVCIDICIGGFIDGCRGRSKGNFTSFRRGVFIGVCIEFCSVVSIGVSTCVQTDVPIEMVERLI